MNQLQRHMLEYMSEVLHQEDIFFSEAWATGESYVMDALGNTPQNTQEHIYTGTGSDYFDCVLGVGGFEKYGPITGDEK